MNKKNFVLLIICFFFFSLITSAFGMENTLKNAKVGDYVKIGCYPQSIDGTVQPIEWQVLSIEEKKILVISKYGLASMDFDLSSNDWKNSAIRHWLNNGFYNKVFTEQEKKYINSFNGDNVFLLSKEEAEKYFANNDARKCKVTYFAKANGAYVADSGNSPWWLRSPYGNNCVCRVLDDGDIGFFYIHNNQYVVRPALWINLY